MPWSTSRKSSLPFGIVAARSGGARLTSPAPRRLLGSKSRWRRELGGRMIEATYDYTDEVGGLVFQVVRFQPKDFRQRRPLADGEWEWNLRGITPPLYRFP